MWTVGLGAVSEGWQDPGHGACELGWQEPLPWVQQDGNGRGVASGRSPFGGWPWQLFTPSRDRTPLQDRQALGWGWVVAFWRHLDRTGERLD